MVPSMTLPINGCARSTPLTEGYRRKKTGTNRPVFLLDLTLCDRSTHDHFRCSLIILVISNIEAWAFWKISFSLASALIMRRFTASCRPCFLM